MSNSPSNDMSSPIVPVPPEYEKVALFAVAEQFRILEAIREGFKKSAQRRSQTFYFPFVLETKDIVAMNQVVCDEVLKIDRDILVSFSGSVKLESRREITFNSVADMVGWSEAERSYPTTTRLHWQYDHIPQDTNLPIPFKYDITIRFETEPDVLNKMSLGIEEAIVLDIQGPTIDWVRNVNEQLETLIESTQMQFYWRILRTAMVRGKPYFSNGLYLGLLSAMVWLWYTLIWDDGRTAVQDSIRSTNDTLKKLDLWISWWAIPTSPKGALFLALIGYPLVGALHLLINELYQWVAPPSFISIGITGKRRHNLLKLYGGLWLLFIGGLVGAIIAKFV